MFRFGRSNSTWLPLIFLIGINPCSLAAYDELAVLRQRQEKIKEVIQLVQPCVVAIAGGTGVIVSEQGHVLTVAHVTSSLGLRVQVKLSDGTEVMATSLGTNSKLDLAVLKLDGDGPWRHLEVPDLSLKDDRTSHESLMRLAVSSTNTLSIPRELSDSHVAIGDWCLAFGYPLSFRRGEPAVVRLGQVTSVTPKQIVSTAVIMGGDSGGPLVDLNGRLIGLCSRVKTTIEANLYVPIAVFVDQWAQFIGGKKLVADKTVDVIKETRKVRPWLGVFGDTDESRVRVRKVQAGSPAATGGLRPEDVILSFDGTDVTAFAKVVELLHLKQPNDTILLKVNRYGAILELSVTLGVAK